jgi:hypothetical protein
VPSGLLLSLLFGVSGPGPEPAPAGGPPAPVEVEGTFGGRLGAIPSRLTSDKFRWLQWNWKLGNIFGDKEWEAWGADRKQKELDKGIEKQVKIEFSAEQDKTQLRNKEIQRHIDERSMQEYANKLKMVQLRAQQKNPRPVNLDKLQQEKNEWDRQQKVIRMKSEMEQQMKDEKALAMKIKMAKLRAKRRK